MRYHLIRLFVCSLFLYFHCLPAAAQSPVKYKEIDDFIKGDQLKVTSIADIRVFGRELKRLFPDDELKARAAFFWLTQHVSYDCEGLKSGNKTHEPADVLATGKAVCSGYASLFKLFCDELGVESVIIRGFSFNYSDPPVNADSLNTNHAWNAVKLKGQWKLVDPTWGSGKTNTGCTEYFKEVDGKYFLADPKFMISRHWPEDPKWQLLDHPYSAKQFADSAAVYKKSILASSNYSSGDSVIKRKVGELVRLRLPKEDQRNFFMVMLYNKAGVRVEDLEIPALFGEDGFYYCDFKVKRAGTYTLEIALFNRTTEEVGYSTTPVVQYKLQVTQPLRR